MTGDQVLKHKPLGHSHSNYQSRKASVVQCDFSCLAARPSSAPVLPAGALALLCDHWPRVASPDGREESKPFLP